MKISKMAYRDYYCPVCGNEQQIQTNHTGEVYSGCKNCGNTVMYCKDAPPREPDGTCRIVFYRFNLENPGEQEDYRELVRFLQFGRGYKKFHVHCTYRAYEALALHNGGVLNIYNRNQFEGQYISNIGRVHDWFESVLPNTKIKRGYYLADWEVK